MRGCCLNEVDRNMAPTNTSKQQPLASCNVVQDNRPTEGLWAPGMQQAWLRVEESQRQYLLTTAVEPCHCNAISEPSLPAHSIRRLNLPHQILSQNSDWMSVCDSRFRYAHSNPIEVHPAPNDLTVPAIWRLVTPKTSRKVSTEDEAAVRVAPSLDHQDIVGVHASAVGSASDQDQKPWMKGHSPAHVMWPQKLRPISIRSVCPPVPLRPRAFHQPPLEPQEWLSDLRSTQQGVGVPKGKFSVMWRRKPALSPHHHPIVAWLKRHQKQ